MPEEFKPPVDNNKPKGITPSQPKPPTEEALKIDFKADDALFTGDDTRVTVDDKPIGDKPKEDDKKPEDKKDEKVVDKPKEEATKSAILKPPAEEGKDKDKAVKEEVKKEEKKDPKVFTPPAKDKVVRDYAGYSNEEVAMLKQMSDAAYKYTTELIKNNKAAAQSKNDIFVQHPDAYTLSDEYRSLQNQVYFANVEGKYWQDALELCKAGKPIKDVKGIDPKTGQLVFGDEVPASDRLEEAIRANMNQCMQTLSQRKGEVDKYGHTFNQKVTTDLQAIEAERSKRFAWVADPKLLDYTVPTDDGDKSIKNIIGDFTSIFPSYQRNSPGVKVAADLMVALIIQSAELKEATNSRTISDTKLEEVKRTEPSSVDKPRDTGKEVNGVKEFSLADLPA